MTLSTTQPNVQPIDDSPTVKVRKPVVRAEDRDGDGKADVYAYDFNGDAVTDAEHRLHDRRTFVMVQRVMPWPAPPSLTLHTGASGETPLRVTFRIGRISELLYEINGNPSLHGMESLGLVWTADREHADELQAAQHFWMANGGVGGFTRE